MKRSWLYLLCQTMAPVMYILLIFTVIGSLIGSLLGSGDLKVNMDRYNEELKLAEKDFKEVIPVLSVPSSGDGMTGGGTLESHKLKSIVSVGDSKYKLEEVELSCMWLLFLVTMNI